MPKIRVDTSEAFCQKKGCKEPAYHRHHRGHEFLFARLWVTRKEKKYKEFVKRYWSFNKEDIVLLCDRHHAEVHLDFDVIILKHQYKLKKYHDLYSFKDAQDLMKELREYTDEWLTRITPGVKPELVFGKQFTRFGGNKRRRIAVRRWRDEQKEKGTDA